MFKFFGLVSKMVTILMSIKAVPSTPIIKQVALVQHTAMVDYVVKQGLIFFSLIKLVS